MAERLLLKLSGEALGSCPFDFKNSIPELSKKITDLSKTYEIGIVIGGGNIFRGINGKEGSNKENNDKLGLKVTILNAEALLNGLEIEGTKVVAMTHIWPNDRVKEFNKEEALNSMKEGSVLIIGGGTGETGCTTDTAAAIKAVELGCKYIVKLSKNINGVYDKDPLKYNDAVKYDTVSFQEALDKKLGVLDKEAFTICQENEIPIIVINAAHINQIPNILNGITKLGTIVGNLRSNKS